MTKIPDYFYKFGSGAHQDADLMYGETIEDLIKGCLNFVHKNEYARLAAYINDLLNSGLSSEELHRIWKETPSDIIFFDEGIRYFFMETVRILKTLI